MARKKEPKEEKLNDRQIRFVYEYQIDQNGTQTVILAGYSPNTAQADVSFLTGGYYYLWGSCRRRKNLCTPFRETCGILIIPSLAR